MTKIEASRRLETLFDEYMGIGEGIWAQDAQEYVNDLRAADR